MAEERDNLSFSIEDTSEMGIGNQALLENLFSSESATAKPDEIEKIEPPKKVKAKVVEDEDEEEEEEEELPKKKKKKVEEDPSKPLKDFLHKEEEEEEEESKTEKEEEESEKGPASNPFSTISKELFNLGVFTRVEGETDVEIDTPEAFADRFRLENKRGAAKELNDFLGQFGEDYQHAFQSIFVKGVNPKEYFGAYNKIEDISELDLAQEPNQVAVIRQTLTDQGLEAEDINTEIERLKNYGDLETVAQRYHKILLKKEATKISQMEAESEARIKQQAEIKTQYVKKVNSVLQEKLQKKEFDGIPINPSLASELQDFLITDKYKTPSGETLTEFDRAILELKRPENHEKKVKLGLLLKIMEKDPTLSTIQNRAVTKKTDTLFAELSRQVPKTSAKTEKAKTSSWFS